MGRKKKKAALSAEQWELVTHGGKCQLCGKALEYPNLACTYDAANSRWTCAAHPYMVLNEKEHRWDMVDTELFHQMDGPRRQAGQQAPADTGEPGERETCPPAHADGGSTAVASTAEARASQTKQESPAAAPNGVLGGGADPSGSAEADAVVERARLRAETRRLRAMVATRDETIAQLESKLEDASYRVLEVQAQARNAGGLLQDATTRAEAAEAEGTRLRDALAEAEDRARAAEAARSEADQEADRHRSQVRRPRRYCRRGRLLSRYTARSWRRRRRQRRRRVPRWSRMWRQREGRRMR